MTELIEGFDYINAKIVRDENVKNEKRDPVKDPNNKNEQRLYLEFPIYGTHVIGQGSNKVEVQNTYTIGVPDRRELQQYIEADREYYDHHYRVWKAFLDDTQRNKHIIIPKMMFRARLLLKGKVQDVYAVAIQARGWNNKEREYNYDTNIGIYNRITFTKERDEKTGELKATGKDKSYPVYEFLLNRNDEESLKGLAYWYEHSEGDMQFYVYPQLGGSRPRRIMDFETFSTATFPELLQCGDQNITVGEFREMYRFFSAKQHAFSTKVSPQ